MDSALVLTVPVLQLGVLLAVVFLWGKKPAGICLATISVTWLVVATLVSAHVGVAAHLMWIVPALWLVALVVRRRRVIVNRGRADAA
jgi:hypothetical protein